MLTAPLCLPGPATTGDAKCKPGNRLRHNHPLLQGRVRPRALSPAEQTGLAALEWLEREQKQQVQRARPLAPEQPAGLPRTPAPGSGQNVLFVPLQALV